MITEHEKFLVEDENKTNDFHAEVNWAPDDTRTNGSKIVKFTFPDGKTAYVKRENLNAILFAIGKPEDQMKMIPQRITKSRWYETILSVKATKDIRKGEQITFPIKLSLPSVEEEVVGEIKKQKNSPILVPKDV